MKYLHHIGIDLLSEVWKLCTRRMNLLNRKKNCCCYWQPSLVTSVLPLPVSSYLLKFVLLIMISYLSLQ